VVWIRLVYIGRIDEQAPSPEARDPRSPDEQDDEESQLDQQDAIQVLTRGSGAA